MFIKLYDTPESTGELTADQWNSACVCSSSPAELSEIYFLSFHRKLFSVLLLQAIIYVFSLKKM